MDTLRAKLTQLEVLCLGETAVTDAAVEPLSKLTRLRSLDLTGTRVTPEGAARLKKALPECQISHP
jgi:hypothetical protein